MTTVGADWYEKGFAIDFRTELKSYFVECVIDYEGDYTLIGIELLGLIADSGGLQEPDTNALRDTGLVSISIDHDADAIYLRTRPGRATHQLKRQAVVIIDDDLRLCRLHVKSHGPDSAAD